MTAPLTGIHAYIITNKPLYAAFLSDVGTQGGSTTPFPPVNEIPDGYFATIPWVGIVVVPNVSYTGDPAVYSNVALEIGGETYPLKLNSAINFSYAVTAYLSGAPSPATQDYFGAPIPTTTQPITVTLNYGDIPYTAQTIYSVTPFQGATTWSEIILNYGNLFTDDIRNQEAYNLNPASFLNNQSYYLASAIPRFNRPMQIVEYLAQQSLPQFNEYVWVVPTPTDPAEGQTVTTEPTTVNTMMPGYSLCSVVIRATDQFGNPVDTSYVDAQYDTQTGTVTFPAGLTFGTQFIIDLYLDGFFLNEITPEMKRILGLCFNEVWEYRFTGEWLPRAAKISDRSFAPPNEANWTRAQSEKRASIEASLNQELLHYEQNCAYKGTVGGSTIFSLY